MPKKEITLLKKWSKQFTKDEWVKLCLNKDFNDILLEDMELAVDTAENILKRKVNSI